jgi:ABC-2 type transport system ATP-binding protein
MSESVIDLKRLSVRLGTRPVLRELEGAVTGRAIGLLGPNGAGKSTLIRTLMGFHAPSEGTARVLGHDVRTHSKLIRGQVGYMPEDEAFMTGMTAVRYVRLMAELSGLPPRQALERAHESLFYVGLGEARYRTLETYSLGMKQQAKLAQALVHGPRLLFLDEPTNGLDPPHRRRMIELIREVRDSGKATVVLSSHLLRDVEECCEEVLVLHQGRIAKYCNLEEERRANLRFLELETQGGDGAFEEDLRGLGCELARHRFGSLRGRLKVILPEGVGVSDVYRVAAARSVQLRRLSYKKDSLEEIFLKAVEGNNGGA